MYIFYIVHYLGKKVSNRHSVVQKILRPSRNPMVHHLIRNSPSFIPAVNQTKPVHLTLFI